MGMRISHGSGTTSNGPTLTGMHFWVRQLTREGVACATRQDLPDWSMSLLGSCLVE